MNKLTTTTIALALSASSAMAFFDITLPGTSSQSNWTSFNAETYGPPNYPIYIPGPGGFDASTDPFAAPISPDSGSAIFNKNTGSGGLFLSTSFGGGLYTANDPGSFIVSEISPLPGLETIVFQIDSNAFPEGAGALLSFNGGSQEIPADILGSVSEVLYAFQWDLSSVGPITDFTIAWDSGIHYANFGMQLNQGDTFAQAIPEPSTYALIFGAIVSGVLFMRRKRR